MQHGNLFIDHIFTLVQAEEVDAVVQELARHGLQESTRRKHVGLGTANIFFCFDNMFLEILWVADRAEALQSALGQRLVARLEGRERGTSPFGIGFRTRSPEDGLPFDTWDFMPPGASGLKPVPLACSSDDPAQPLLFRAQRVLRPDQWIDGKAGARQVKTAISEISEVHFSPPPGAECCADLLCLQALGLVKLGNSSDRAEVTLKAPRAGGRQPFELKLYSPLGQTSRIES